MIHAKAGSSFQHSFLFKPLYRKHLINSWDSKQSVPPQKMGGLLQAKGTHLSLPYVKPNAFLFTSE